MKKIALILTCFATTSGAWAAAYSIDLETQVGAQKPIKRQLTVYEGQESSISYQDTVVKFVPTETEQGALKIEAEVFKRTKRGLKRISKPTIIVRQNEPGEISEMNESGAPLIRLKVTPKRLNSTIE